MYDKIKLKLCAWALPSNYRWQDVVARLALSQYRGDDTGGSGKWRGRKVIATETYVSFEGSLPKCLWGHNTRTMSLKDAERCIMMLSEELGVPMYNAEVESLEFAHNFEMSQPPISYLRKLSGIKKFIPNQWSGERSGTAYFDYEGTRIKIYDKMSEAKKKRELPKVGRNSLSNYLLRYEMTLGIDELFELFGKGITANELWDKYVFWKLVAEWFGYYEDIDKLPDDCWDVEFDTLKSAKDFDKWCTCIANEGQNLSYYMKYILFKNRKNRLPKDRILHTQFQKRIQEAMKWQKEHFKTSSLMEELTGKIEKYLVWLLEQSADGMSIAEEHRIFSTAC